MTTLERGSMPRALGAQTWLISTVDRMTKQFLTWGQDAILLNPVQSWHERTKPTIVAGKQPRTPDPWDDMRL